MHLLMPLWPADLIDCKPSRKIQYSTPTLRDFYLNSAGYW
jgi:hypothetical protein